MKRYHIYVHFYFRTTTPTDRKKTKRKRTYDDFYDPHPSSCLSLELGSSIGYTLCVMTEMIFRSASVWELLFTAAQQALEGFKENLRVWRLSMYLYVYFLNTDVHLPSYALCTNNFRDCCVVAM